MQCVCKIRDNFFGFLFLCREFTNQSANGLLYGSLFCFFVLFVCIDQNRTNVAVDGVFHQIVIRKIIAHQVIDIGVHFGFVFQDFLSAHFQTVGNSLRNRIEILELRDKFFFAMGTMLLI
ncbi:MAG: hypothetical protein V8T34_00360 [Ruminococcus callidus]